MAAAAVATAPDAPDVVAVDSAATTSGFDVSEPQPQHFEDASVAPDSTVITMEGIAVDMPPPPPPSTTTTATVESSTAAVAESTDPADADQTALAAAAASAVAVGAAAAAALAVPVPAAAAGLSAAAIAAATAVAASASAGKSRRSNKSSERPPKLVVMSVQDGTLVDCSMENRAKTITFKFDISDVNPTDVANDLVSVFFLFFVVLFGCRVLLLVWGV